jgi:hypothetical protein
MYSITTSHDQYLERGGYPGPSSLEEMWGYATILFTTICDYVSFATTFATTYQLHQIWGGFATIL